MIAFAHIEAPVGIRRAEPASLRRASRVERHRGGIEAHRALKRRELLVGGHVHRRVDEIGQGLFEPCPAQALFGLGEILSQSGQLLFSDATVLRLDRGIHDREHKVEQIAHAAVVGEQLLGGVGLAHDSEQVLGLGAEPAKQELRGGFQVKRPVVCGQEQQRHEKGAHRDAATPAGGAAELGLEVIGHLRRVDHLGTKAHLLVAVSPGAGHGPSGAHRPSRSARRSAALDCGALSR
jgi:hypothetical protein